MSDNTPAKEQDPKKKEENVKAAMKIGLDLAKKLGRGAAELLKKLKKDNSPEAMIETLDGHLAANQTRRAETSGRVERLYADIVARKKAYKTAPKARQRILQAELKSMLTGYKAAERELSILLENEQNLSLIKGRVNEVVAYGMAGVSELVIDDVIDDIEEKVAGAEAIADASRDLEKAGKRRIRESDSEDMWSDLEDFGEEEPSSLDTELEGFGDDEPAEPTAASESGPEPVPVKED